MWNQPVVLPAHQLCHRNPLWPWHNPLISKYCGSSPALGSTVFAWASGFGLEMVIWCMPISSLFCKGKLQSQEDSPGNTAGQITQSKKTKTAIIKNQENCHRLNPILSYSNIPLPHPSLQIMLSIKEAFFSPKQNTIFLRKELNPMN